MDISNAFILEWMVYMDKVMAHSPRVDEYTAASTRDGALPGTAPF